MSRSSEEVYLIINHVKHKKTEGTLYLMGERIAWMPDGKDSFSISHLYADIRVQKISPESKEKIQLQLVMHDGSANTFQFSNPMGRASQLKDRESAKELLQQLLPKFRRKINNELEEKNRMLQEDPELFQLYKDLVVSGVISADEFWASKQGQNQQVSNTSAKVNQDVGVSPAFLADIKPQADGCNGLRYNLTADIVESIFRTYPAVKMKHAENVPDKISENDFWTRFFQSHYFHRDRINISNKDLFSECAKKDEEDIQQEIQEKINDPLLDLTQMADSTLGEGYGSTRDDTQIATNPSNLSLIRRFNHHSTMVLKACDKKTQPSSSSSSLSSSKSSQGAATNGSSSSIAAHLMINGDSNGASEKEGDLSLPPSSKKAKLKEKIHLDDLEEEGDSSGPALNLAKMERYLHGPTPITTSQYHTSEDMIQASFNTQMQVKHWIPNLTQVMTSSSAVSILGEISPGGALMQGTSQQQLDQMVPAEIQQELRSLYLALCELLRHFWSCFPTTTKALEEKVVRMKANLERFQSAKLNAVKAKLTSSYTVNLIGHMEEMLNAAYAKFGAWQNKRLGKK
ncbi:general transcription factor IIH subunit 1 [Lingula anatina]|uniref:General transcription factor IIH subunit 1 n=1 Tax=Lingula anatina TaxID=7574 RepID=A0A1S3JWB3_LINAN|nr:general transcription factor IIH subunit 1 [Lingula anatina]XP_013414328.1 general transcription factor IIH subunit 1 [Lingula anatina]XP_013414329.1 general transcription factor IIH subunit 1 [Lingula anatina]XP_013414330.1 general transcription factor IIH subunit 1 [Lingula anatina]|eukprot:XP_013414327.1 general transcription factor IIH subunit 1 [Lingula anatina]